MAVTLFRKQSQGRINKNLKIKTCNALEANIKRTMADPVAGIVFVCLFLMSFSLFMY